MSVCMQMCVCLRVKLNNVLSVSSIASCQTNRCTRTRTHTLAHKKPKQAELIMTNFVIFTNSHQLVREREKERERERERREKKIDQCVSLCTRVCMYVYACASMSPSTNQAHTHTSMVLLHVRISCPDMHVAIYEKVHGVTCP